MDSLNPRVGFIGASVSRFNKSGAIDKEGFITTEQIDYYIAQDKVVAPNGAKIGGTLRAHGKLVGFDVTLSNYNIDIYDGSGIITGKLSNDLIKKLSDKGKALTNKNTPLRVKLNYSGVGLENKGIKKSAEQSYSETLDNETIAELLIEGMFITQGNVLTGLVPHAKAREIYIKKINERKGKVSTTTYNRVYGMLKRGGLFDDNLDERIKKNNEAKAVQKQKEAPRVTGKPVNSIAKPVANEVNAQWVVTDVYARINVKNNKEYNAIYDIKNLMDGTVKRIDGKDRLYRLARSGTKIINVNVLPRPVKDKAGNKIGMDYQVTTVPQYRGKYPIRSHNAAETVRLGLGTKHTEKILEKRSKK